MRSRLQSLDLFLISCHSLIGAFHLYEHLLNGSGIFSRVINSYFWRNNFAHNHHLRSTVQHFSTQLRGFVRRRASTTARVVRTSAPDSGGGAEGSVNCANSSVCAFK